MRPLGWIRLVVPGVCCCLLPACFAPASPSRQPRPFTGDSDTRNIDAAWSRGYRTAAPPQYLTPGADWSPYNHVARGSTTQGPIAGVAAPPRPQNPPATGNVEPVGMPRRSTEDLKLVANKPTPVLASPAAKNAAQTTEQERPSQPLPPRKLPKSLLEEPELIAALRCYLEKRPGDVPKELRKSDPQTREILLTLMPLTVRVSEGGLATADANEVAVVVDQLQGLLWSLRPRAALVMDKFCFCRVARRFGKFEALEDRPVFQPGQMVEVYAEIRNVASELHRSQQGDYRTHLRSTLDIRGPTGERAWPGPKEFDKPDETMTPQHDYFQHFRFQIPHAESGAYVLHLEVVDVPTGRKVHQQLEFTIGSPGKVARAE